MKSRSTRIALLSALIFTSPAVTFAGGQPAKYYYTPRKGEAQTAAGRAWDRRALGMKFVVERRSNAKRAEQGSADRMKSKSITRRPNWGDAAFRR
jgi:hypothetical protein